MDAKKTIKKYICPSAVLPIILLIPPLTVFGLLILLFSTLPVNSRAKKCLAKLEASGQLPKAAAELMSPTAKHWMKGNIILTENYIFCKNSGYIFTYDEVRWVYKHRLTQRFLFIPVSVTDSLYLATATMKPKQVAVMGKDKMDEIKNAILEIYRHNNRCMVGYSNENVAAYKAASRR